MDKLKNMKLNCLVKDTCTYTFARVQDSNNVWGITSR